MKQNLRAPRQKILRVGFERRGKNTNEVSVMIWRMPKRAENTALRAVGSGIGLVWMWTPAKALRGLQYYLPRVD